MLLDLLAEGVLVGGLLHVIMHPAVRCEGWVEARLVCGGVVCRFAARSLVAIAADLFGAQRCVHVGRGRRHQC